MAAVECIRCEEWHDEAVIAAAMPVDVKAARCEVAMRHRVQQRETSRNGATVERIMGKTFP
jgi:hypothetical protein